MAQKGRVTGPRSHSQVACKSGAKKKKGCRWWKQILLHLSRTWLWAGVCSGLQRPKRDSQEQNFSIFAAR